MALCNKDPQEQASLNESVSFSTDTGTQTLLQSERYKSFDRQSDEKTLKKNVKRKNNSTAVRQTKENSKSKKKREKRGTNNGSSTFHNHSSNQHFQMKKLSIQVLSLIVNRNTYVLTAVWWCLHE